MLFLQLGLSVIDCSSIEIIKSKIGFVHSDLDSEKSACFQFYKNSVILFHTVSNIEYETEVKDGSSTIKYSYADENKENIVGFYFNNTGIIKFSNVKSQKSSFSLGYTSIDDSYQYITNDDFYLRYSNENIHPIIPPHNSLVYYIGSPNCSQVNFLKYGTKFHIFPKISIANATNIIASFEDSTNVSVNDNFIISIGLEGKHLNLLTSHDMIISIDVKSGIHPEIPVTGYLDKKVGGFLHINDFSYVFMPAKSDNMIVLVASISSVVIIILIVLIVLGILKAKKNKHNKDGDNSATKEALVV